MNYFKWRIRKVGDIWYITPPIDKVTMFPLIFWSFERAREWWAWANDEYIKERMHSDKGTNTKDIP